jgi:hypothetical protein
MVTRESLRVVFVVMNTTLQGDPGKVGRGCRSENDPPQAAKAFQVVMAKLKSPSVAHSRGVDEIHRVGVVVSVRRTAS